MTAIMLAIGEGAKLEFRRHVSFAVVSNSDPECELPKKKKKKKKIPWYTIVYHVIP